MPAKMIQVSVPRGLEKVPTGAIQFKNDGPGLFIRSEDAFLLAATIRSLQQRHSARSDALVDALLTQLGQIADVIENDVIVE